MKSIIFVLLMATAVAAQTAPKTAPSASRSAAQTTHKSGSAAAAAKTLGELPPVQGTARPLFTERVQDILVGSGKLAEPQKIYRVRYSGYLAATGQKFDSSEDHRLPLLKDGKQVLGPDGKPELSQAQPLVFPQGMGRLIPGFDAGFEGMRVGGKRRIFIPWQLAYGMREIPGRDGHVGIPPKSDLIFDVELVDVTDMPAIPAQPATGQPAPSQSQPAASPAATPTQPRATVPSPDPPSTPPAGKP